MKKMMIAMVIVGLSNVTYSAEVVKELHTSINYQKDEGYEDEKRLQEGGAHSLDQLPVENQKKVNSDNFFVPSVRRVQWHGVAYNDDPAGKINFEESPLSQKEKHAILRQQEVQHAHGMLEQEAEEDERVLELSEIEAEYEVLVGPARARLLSINPANMSSSEIKTLNKTIAYLGIFKGFLVQLEQHEGQTAQELAKVTAFKKRIIKERKDLLALQEKVGM